MNYEVESAPRLEAGTQDLSGKVTGWSYNLGSLSGFGFLFGVFGLWE